MTTLEQLEAPQIGVAKTVERDPLDEIPDMEAHCYDRGEDVAYCGLSFNKDVHGNRHRREGRRYFYKQGDETCGNCGAPICEVCLAELKRRMNWI